MNCPVDFVIILIAIDRLFGSKKFSLQKYAYKKYNRRIILQVGVGGIYKAVSRGQGAPALSAIIL